MKRSPAVKHQGQSSGFLPGMEDAQRKVDLSQWYTADWLAERFWRWLNRHQFMPFGAVLEPSAGVGNLVLPMLMHHCPREILCLETDSDNVAKLNDIVDHGPLNRERDGTLKKIMRVAHCDFTLLSIQDLRQHDFGLAAMNPPFEDGQDIQHLNHAMDCCRMVGGILKTDIEHSAGRWDFWRHVDIVRKVTLVERPKFDGHKADGKKNNSPMSDYGVYELRRRPYARKQGEPSTLQHEFWTREA